MRRMKGKGAPKVNLFLLAASGVAQIELHLDHMKREKIYIAFYPK
jgi:hypothetical protein